VGLLGKILGHEDGESDPPLTSLPDDRIVQFYGTWCGYCRMIEDDVDRLESEGVDMLRLEVWGNRNNKRLMEDLSGLIEEFNRGNYTVPMFYDARKQRSQQLLVNPRGYDEIMGWMGSGNADTVAS